MRLVICVILLTAVMASSKIDSSLWEVLNSGKTAKLIVSMTSCPEKVNDSDDTQKLLEYAKRCQATVLGLLETEKNRLAISWESLIPDQTLVNGADLKLTNEIAALENVAKIEGEKFVDLL